MLMDVDTGGRTHIHSGIQYRHWWLHKMPSSTVRLLTAATVLLVGCSQQHVKAGKTSDACCCYKLTCASFTPGATPPTHRSAAVTRIDSHSWLCCALCCAGALAANSFSFCLLLYITTLTITACCTRGQCGETSRALLAIHPSVRCSSAADIPLGT